MKTGEVVQHLGIWLPAHEAHMSEWMRNRMRTHPDEMVDGRGTYQFHKFRAAMKFTRDFRVAIDVGAHCGLWSMNLTKCFETVHAFEPIPLHRECFEKNVTGGGKVRLYPFALGEEDGMVSFHVTHGSSGDSFVQDNGGAGDTVLRRLDGLWIDSVDFIKLDCEGYELFALRGGEELIKRSRPTICVEQKPGKAPKYGLGETDAVGYLQSLGAVLRKEIGGDYILSWDK